MFDTVSQQRRRRAAIDDLTNSSRCDCLIRKIVENLAHTAPSSQRAMPDGTGFVEMHCRWDETKDENGYACLCSAVSHALRHLSPLSAAAAVGVSQCVA
jgi:hypothetical protein